MHTAKPQTKPMSTSDEELGYASAEGSDSDSAPKTPGSPSKSRKRVMSKETIATINYGDLKKRLEAALLESKSKRALQRDAENALRFLATLSPETSDFDKKRLLALNEQLYRKKIIPEHLTTQIADENHFTWKDVVIDLNRGLRNEGETWEDFAYRTLETGVTLIKDTASYVAGNVASTIINYSGSLFNQYRAPTLIAIEEKRPDSDNTETSSPRHH